MRAARLFVVWLLSLGVILQGYAGVRVMDASCPMHHADYPAPSPSLSDHVGHDAGMDHTGMHQTGAEHGEQCQHDLGCQSVGLAICAPAVVLLGGPAVQHVLAAPAPSFHSFTPPLLARPPALA